MNMYTRSLLLFLVLASFSVRALSQESAAVISTKKHKLLLQLATDDTLAQKSLLSQVENFMTLAPKSKVEVVCHNKGITLLLQDGNRYAPKVKAWSAKGVDFVACEYTMKQRKIKRADLIAECRTVPAAIVEIVTKQEQKWVYVKAGY